MVARSGEDATLSALFLDEHVVFTVAEQIDIGIDGGITPVEKQLRLRQTGERLVGIAVVHAVVAFLGTVQHGIVDEVAALVAIVPHVVGIPENLRCPYAVDGRPILVDALGLRVAEDAGALAVVEGHRGPVDQVVAFQQVDAVVVPLVRLCHAHVGGHHHIALAVPSTANVGIALSALNAGMFLGVHDGIALQQVFIVVAVAAQGIGGVLTAVAHVAIQVAVGALLKVLGLGRHHLGEEKRKKE